MYSPYQSSNWMCQAASWFFLCSAFLSSAVKSFCYLYNSFSLIRLTSHTADIVHNKYSTVNDFVAVHIPFFMHPLHSSHTSWNRMKEYDDEKNAVFSIVRRSFQFWMCRKWLCAWCHIIFGSTNSMYLYLWYCRFAISLYLFYYNKIDCDVVRKHTHTVRHPGLGSM